MPLKGGCIDHVAVLSARLHGWQTKTFTERVCMHHRLMGTALHGGLKAKFRLGMKDYSVGNHPLWQIFRTVYQMKNSPYVVGGLSVGAGYCWSLLRRAEIPIPSELVTFVRREQMHRLRRLFFRTPKADAERAAGRSEVSSFSGSRSPSGVEEKKQVAIK